MKTPLVKHNIKHIHKPCKLAPDLGICACGKQLKTPQKKTPDVKVEWNTYRKVKKPTGKAWKPEINNSVAFWYIDSFLEPENDTIGVRIPKLRKGYIVSGNYFRTKALAQNAAKAVRNLLKTLPHG